MADWHLVDYFRKWKSKGYSVEQIKDNLLRHNYDLHAVEDASIASQDVKMTNLNPKPVFISSPTNNKYRKTLMIAAALLTVFVIIVVAYFIVDKDLSFLGFDNESITVFTNSSSQDEFISSSNASENITNTSSESFSSSLNYTNMTNVSYINSTNSTIVWSNSGGSGGGHSSDSSSDEDPDPIPTCSDNIQNQGEAGIDCGGPCATCAHMNYLVRNSTALSDIVVSSSAPSMVQLAAIYFQMYILNITNVTLPISNTSNESFDFHVYIGQSNYTDALGINSSGCENGGFKIVSGEDYLVLLGDDIATNISNTGPADYEEWDALTNDTWTNDYLDYYGNSYSDTYDIWEEDKRGSINAVYEFLYDQGIRWYHPGWYEHPGMGTIIPSKEDISFSDVNSLTNPDFAMREFYMYSMGFGFSSYHYDNIFEETFQWQLSLRGNSYYEFLIGSLGGPGHGIRAVIAREETESEHPEYYAVLDGVRMNESNPVPNLCSQGLLEENIKYVKAMFDIYNVSMVSVMPTDGFTQASDDCAYMETPERGFEGQLSNYVWEYVNNLAWAIHNDSNYTGKRIFAGAYTTYQLPPDNLSQPMAPNIAVVITKWRTDTADEAYKEYFQNITNQWYDLLPSHEVYTYDYYLHNLAGANTQSVPFYFPNLIGEDLKFLKNKSRGEIMEISSTSVWPPYEFTNSSWNLRWDAFATNSFNTYITARLYWNASQNVSKLLDEYYNLYYGPANESMKAFVEYSEAHIIDVMQNPTIISTMRQMLNDARIIAGNNVYGYRIDLLIGLMNSTGTGEIMIDSCQDLSAPATIYKLTSDVNSTDSCFVIGNVGVTLDCQGHKIIYGTDGGDSEHAVYMPYTMGTYATTIKNCNIQNNVSIGDNRDAIQFPTSVDVIIYNNMINTSSTGIWLIDSSNINVTNNTIISNSTDAFSTQEIYGGIISNNKFLSNSGQGVYLYDTNNVTMTSNNVSSVSNYGIYLVLGGNNTFINNMFTSNTNLGWLEYDSYNNTYVNNTISP